MPLALTEFWELFIHFSGYVINGVQTKHVKPRMRCNERKPKSEIYAYIYGCHLFQITSQTLEKYYHYRKIKVKMGCLYSNWTPTFLLGGGGGEGELPLDSKVIGMLVVFFRV